MPIKPASFQIINVRAKKRTRTICNGTRTLWSENAPSKDFSKTCR